jgi:hypothetical protein
MNKFWLTALAALALGCYAGPARAQDPTVLDVAPAEPVFTIVPRHAGSDPDAGPPIRPYQITLASGIYLLQPTFTSDPALVVSRPGIPQTQQLDFSRHMIASPAVWLGVSNVEGWGFRFRWYTLDQNAALIAAAAPGEQFSAASPLSAVQTPVFGTADISSELHIDSYDFEATCQMERCKWCLLLGGGVRYVHLDQVYASNITDVNGISRIALSRHNFNGAGPTFSLSGRRPFHSCFALYGNLHGSVLFGGTGDDFQASNALTGQNQSFSRHQIGVLPIGELEVGAELSHCFHRARLFLQTGFVGQVYWGAGSASNFDALNSSATSNNNLGMVGLAVRAGLAF